MRVDHHVQVKGDVPRSLKLRTFSALALRDIKFNAWLGEKMRRWLAEVEAEERTAHLESRETDYAATR